MHNTEQHSRFLRRLVFAVIPVALVIAGWYTVMTQSWSLEQATISSYQAAQTEIVESAARAVDVYMTRELQQRGDGAIPAIEQEVLRLFIQPIQIGTEGDAWIHSPDYVIFDESEDFPSEFVGQSIEDVFRMRSQEDEDTRPRRYEELVTGITTAQPGVSQYIWLPDKAQEFTPWWEFLTRDSGIEIAAWTTVEVFPGTDEARVWVIGLTSLLPEVMHINGAYAQVQSSISTMLLVTVGTGGLLLLLWQRERALYATELRYRAIVEEQTELVARFRPDGTLTFVNGAWTRYFAQSAAALLGTNILDLLAESHRETTRTRLHQFQNGDMHEGTVEQQVCDAQGEARWILASERAICNAQGHLTEIQMVAHDITDRKRAEADRVQMEQERAALQQQLIDAQQSTLRELSSPLIPISDTVVLMPLVGTLDTRRVEMVQATLLQGVATYRATLAILDITGIPVVDTQVASALVQVSRAIRLLGAEVMLTGIQPQIAQTLVHLGADLSDIRTESNLQTAIAVALQRPRQKVNT